MSLQKQFARDKQNLVLLRKLVTKIKMKEIIKESRKRIDAMLNVLKQHQNSREYYKGYDNLQLGFMRLGLVLAAIGEANPYPDSTNPDNSTIEPPTDKAEFVFELDREAEVLNVKLIRQTIDSELFLLIEILLPKDENKKLSYPAFHALQSAIDVLHDSKMWYGQVLNNIRENEIAHQKFLIENSDRMLKQVMDAYERYGAVTEYKNFRGDPMPKFEELPEKIKEAWFASVQPRDWRNNGSSGVHNQKLHSGCL